MTREQAKEILPIIQAFAEGKHIQWRNHCKNWIDVDERYGLDIEFPSSVYRIKPEYRPFESQEECREEMHKHPDFGWIIAKDSKIMYHIYVIGIGHVLIHSMSISFPETFAEYEFTDGTPFGINKEE